MAPLRRNNRSRLRLITSVGKDGFGPSAACNIKRIGKTQMYNIIYIVGLIVVVLAILSFVGLA